MNARPDPHNDLNRWPADRAHSNDEHHAAWVVMFKERRTYGFSDYRDAQNNAARGDPMAIYALADLQREVFVRRLIE